MIDTSDFKNGVIFEWEGQIYKIIWFQHHKPGKGGAVMRTKMRNIRTGSIIEQTFKSGVKFREVQIERRKKQYLYNDGKNYFFMDLENYEEIQIPKEQLGEAVKFLKENLEIEGLYIDGGYLGVDLPINMEFKVTYTVPGVKGDTVSSVMKPATIETGAEVAVPLFIDIDDVIRIDTRTGEYVERVS
ncbi:MAG: elongation factor P [Elusimicrobia bacterium RIFOXYA2_FULL_39_19]|nr:MAG: elongation factor P [Elusimicrobia bacterium RIFOXYA2_FULL_39_19]